MNFKQLVTERHSAVNFIEDFVMTEEDFKNIFDLTKTAPSSYNGVSIVSWTHFS